MATQSLSRGIFAFKGKRKRLNVADYVENSNGLEKQQMVHQKQLDSRFDEICKSLYNEVSDDLYKDVISYIKGCHPQKSHDEIHAAAIVTGVNTPDHTALFTALIQRIQGEITPFTALLKYKPSASGVRHLMRSIATQLNDAADVESLPTANCTFGDIAKWYSALGQRTTKSSPKKLGKQTKGSTSGGAAAPVRPVVIVFKDFGSYPTSTIQDLLIACKNHLDRLPVVLVFGVSLSLNTLRTTLTHELSTILSIEAFQMTSSSKFLSSLVQKMLIESNVEFRIGGKVLQLLLDNFLCHDFSVHKFVHSLKFCVMDHTLGNRHALSSVTGGSKAPRLDLDRVRRLMSFRRYVENCPPVKQIKLLEDDVYTRGVISSFIEDIEKHHGKQPVILRCVHQLVKDIPGSSLGKQVRELYYQTLCEGFPIKLQQCFKVLSIASSYHSSNISRTELESQLDFFIDNLSVCPVEICLDRLIFVREKLTNFDKLLAETQEESSSPSLKAGKRVDMYTLRRTLQQLKPRHVTLYDEMRTEALDALQQLIVDNIPYYKTFPLHELIYYDDVKTLKAAVNAMPRAAAHTALTRPHVYLHSLPPPTSDQTISPSLPDTATAFKLHLECGSIINVYDWMQAFLAVKSSSNTKASTQELSARFTQSAAEMQFLGFIKSTRRKTDHVTRLTWGGV